jgi:hypothetical protein
MALVAAPAGADVRSAVPLAGGAAPLAESAALRRSPGPSRVLLEVTRVIYDAPVGDAPGVDARRAKVLQYLAAPAAGQADDVPLPLTPAIWRTILGRQVADSRLALDILADRASALLYTGLYSLDDDTLGWFAANPQTLAAIHNEHAGVFAAFGRSIRIRGGKVQAPGGGAHDGTWERLVGESLARPAEFVPRLLSRGRGRMAFFYDTMAHVDGPRLKFALAGDPQRLYEAFSRPEEEWRPTRRPFNRTAVDGALLFSAIHVDEAGRFVGPQWSELWEDVLSRGCAARGRGTDGTRDAEIARSTPIDAAWLASRVVAPGVGRARERLRLVLFAQRVFPAPPPSAASQIRDALCGLARAPALILSLERVGVRDPALYARAAALVERLPGQPEGSEQRPRLIAIQAAIALVIYARQNRSIGGDAAGALLTGAFDAAEASLKSDAGPVLDWIDQSLVPAFAKATGLSPANEAVERIVMAAAAGVRANAAGPPVEWEGMAYRVDPASARLGDAERVRARQRSASLDVALAGHRLTTGRPLGDDKATVLSLKDAGANGPDDDGGGDDARSLAAFATSPSRAVSHAIAADSLASIVYALSVGPSTTAAARAANVARRHALRSAAAGIGPTAADIGWDIPSEEFGPGGWMVRGSLIALDIGLARLALRRQLDTGLPPPPEVSDNDRRTLAETVRLMSWSDLADADRDALSSAIARGRERAHTLLAEPGGVATLATEARMDEVRRQAIAWIAARDKAAAFEELWLSDFVALGKPGIPADRLDRWGTSALPLEGGLAVRYPAGDACLLAGRPAIGMTAMTVPDVALRVIEVLAEMKLPAALAPDMMAYATQQMIDHATTLHSDDRDALASAARRLSADDMVDVVAALTASGPLVPRRTP